MQHVPLDDVVSSSSRVERRGPEKTGTRGHDGFLDAAKRPSRVRGDGAVSAPVAGGQVMKFAITMTFHDFNQPVSVTVPPADQVRDASALKLGK